MNRRRQESEDHGLHPLARPVLLVVLDEPLPMQSQHMAKRRSWAGLCGAFGQTVAIEGAVTCGACKAVLRRRTKAIELLDAQARKGGKR